MKKLSGELKTQTYHDPAVRNGTTEMWCRYGRLPVWCEAGRGESEEEYPSAICDVSARIIARTSSAAVGCVTCPRRRGYNTSAMRKVKRVFFQYFPRPRVFILR